jgi:hypothetical protein
MDLDTLDSLIHGSSPGTKSKKSKKAKKCDKNAIDLPSNAQRRSPGPLPSFAHKFLGGMRSRGQESPYALRFPEPHKTT